MVISWTQEQECRQISKADQILGSHYLRFVVWRHYFTSASLCPMTLTYSPCHFFFFSFFRYMAEDNYSIAWVSACSRLEKDCTYCIPKYAVVDPAWLYWLWWWWGRGGVPWYLLKWLPAPTSVGEEEGSWGMGCVSKIYTTTNRTEQHLPNEWMTWDSVFFNFKAHDFSNTSCSLQTFASEITVSITSVKEKGLV